MTRDELLAKALFEAQADGKNKTSLTGLTSNPVYNQMSLDDKATLLSTYAQQYKDQIGAHKPKLLTSGNILQVLKNSGLSGAATAVGILAPTVANSVIQSAFSGTPIHKGVVNTLKELSPGLKNIAPYALGIGGILGGAITVRKILEKLRNEKKIYGKLNDLNSKTGDDRKVSSYATVLSLPSFMQEPKGSPIISSGLEFGKLVALEDEKILAGIHSQARAQAEEQNRRAYSEAVVTNLNTLNQNVAANAKATIDLNNGLRPLTNAFDEIEGALHPEHIDPREVMHHIKYGPIIKKPVYVKNPDGVTPTYQSDVDELNYAQQRIANKRIDTLNETLTEILNKLNEKGEKE